MSRVHRGPKTMLAAAGCVAALATGVAVPATASAATTSICTSARHPRIAGRISRGIASAIASRPGSFVGLAASDPAEGLSCSYRQSTHFYSASVVKATILSALLLKEGGPAHLTTAQRNLARLMITQSSNSAATALWNEVGITGMQRFLNSAGMGQTILNHDAWGLTLITAHDELRLLQLLTARGPVLSGASRHYVLTLMAQVISAERWGVSAGAPSNVTVHIKNGWLPYPGGDDWRINSIGAFTGKGITYEIVILTGPPDGDGQGESYGIDTIQLAAAVINRNLAGTSASTAAPPSDGSLDAPGG
jgi:beta-lactamase class A